MTDVPGISSNDGSRDLMTTAYPARFSPWANGTTYIDRMDSQDAREVFLLALYEQAPDFVCGLYEAGYLPYLDAVAVPRLDPGGVRRAVTIIHNAYRIDLKGETVRPHYVRTRAEQLFSRRVS